MNRQESYEFWTKEDFNFKGFRFETCAKKWQKWPTNYTDKKVAKIVCFK